MIVASGDFASLNLYSYCGNGVVMKAQNCGYGESIISNSHFQAIVDGGLTFVKGAASAWAGGAIGGKIGIMVGNFIPIPVVGPAIGFCAGGILGVAVSWVVDDALGYVKDNTLDLIFG